MNTSIYMDSTKRWNVQITQKNVYNFQYIFSIQRIFENASKE